MRRTLTVIPLVLAAALLAGCSSSAGSASDMVGTMYGPSPAQDSMQFDGSSVSGSPEMYSLDPERASSSVVGPQIITNVDLTVTVTKPLTAADDAAKVATKHGGSISYRTESAATDRSPGSAQLTLRIPSAKLTAALDELKELGVARDIAINSVDVHAQVTDLGARITSLQTSVDRLLTLMAQATSTENLLAVESALSQRQAELESLQAQKRSLDDQVQLSTVNLYLVSELDTPAPDPDNFLTGLAAGWNAFVGFWAAALVAFGVFVPWLIALVVLAGVALVWFKTARRRRRRTASESSEVIPLD